MNITISASRPLFDRDSINEYNENSDKSSVPRSRSNQSFKNTKKESPFSQPYVPNKQQDLVSTKHVFSPQKVEHKPKEKQNAHFDPKRNSNEVQRNGFGHRNEFYGGDTRKGISRSRSGNVGKIIQIGQKFQDPPPLQHQPHRNSDFDQPYFPNSHMVEDQTHKLPIILQEQRDYNRGKKGKGFADQKDQALSPMEKSYKPRCEGANHPGNDCGASQGDGSTSRLNYGQKGKGQSPRRPAAGGIF